MQKCQLSGWQGFTAKISYPLKKKFKFKVGLFAFSKMLRVVFCFICQQRAWFLFLFQYCFQKKIIEIQQTRNYLLKGGNKRILTTSQKNYAVLSELKGSFKIKIFQATLNNDYLHLSDVPRKNPLFRGVYRLGNYHKNISQNAHPNKGK